ncbi:NAD kinase [Prolixibacteraceae bacterium JC049]|nr:NAD kinase [Prolixibacteraceae bacterium JC049]
MRIGIFGKNINENYYPHLLKIISTLNKKQAHISMYWPFFKTLNKDFLQQVHIDHYIEKKEEFMELDLLFSIGGDGTFLESIKFIRDSNIPIVGFNSGRLGFLADISKNQIENALQQIFANEYRIEERSLLELISPENQFGTFNYALNEVTFHKSDTSSMITIHTFINGHKLNSYWADGLIISSPTGSTAYSMSAGGPIMSPDSNNFIITPIAPHHLTVRPIVVPDNYKLRFEIEGRGEHFLTSLDSRSEVTAFSAKMEVKKADFNIRIIKLRDHDFYSTLRNKLMWGQDNRN